MFISVIYQHGSLKGIHMAHSSKASLPPLIPSQPSRISQSPSLSSLNYTTNSHWLSILHMLVYMYIHIYTYIYVIYICICYSLYYPTLSFLPTPPMSISLFSLPESPLHTYKQVHQHQFSRVYICINIQYLFFSIWLTSLCIIGSTFIHLKTTDSSAFFYLAE